MCKHKQDFCPDAEWHFFATSHSKGPCDGIGSTVKRLVAKASLQRTKDHILTVTDMYDFCEKNITGINLCLVDAEEIRKQDSKLTRQLNEARPDPNTRGNHCFRPRDHTTINISRTSASPNKHNFIFKILNEDKVELEGIKEKDTIACAYGDKYHSR